METSELMPGDILLIDSQKTGAKIVKFFMTAPTLWQWIYRAIRKTNMVVKYYHVAMVYDSTRRIEQQAKVMYKDLYPLPEHTMVVRNKHITDVQRKYLQELADSDMGRGWDVPNAIGKFFTWLTGIKWFARNIHWPTEEICVDRVATWYFKVLGTTFDSAISSDGVSGSGVIVELTTQQMYGFLKVNPQDWDILLES